MLMSELVTHASAEKCGDLLKVRQPTQGALHKGATLIIMVLFFLKHSTNLSRAVAMSCGGVTSRRNFWGDASRCYYLLESKLLRDLS